MPTSRAMFFPGSSAVATPVSKIETKSASFMAQNSKEWHAEHAPIKISTLPAPIQRSERPTAAKSLGTKKWRVRIGAADITPLLAELLNRVDSLPKLCNALRAHRLRAVRIDPLQRFR